MLKIGLIIFVAFLLPFHAAAQILAPSLGPYGRLDTYCGEGEIPKDPAVLPWIGCFYLSEGHSIVGVFLNHRIEIEIADGMEAFAVDNISVATIRDPETSKFRTNLPFVQVGGTPGYWICEGNDTCPSHIEVFSRNPDKSVLFMVSECPPSHRTLPSYKVCVSTQSNWDYEVSQPR